MKPNNNFKLDVDDIDLIEQALNCQLSRLSMQRIQYIPSTVELETVQQLDEKINAIRDLLGRIHNQKFWYRPKSSTYISG